MTRAEAEALLADYDAEYRSIGREIAIGGFRPSCFDVNEELRKRRISRGDRDLEDDVEWRHALGFWETRR